VQRVLHRSFPCLWKGWQNVSGITLEIFVSEHIDVTDGAFWYATSKTILTSLENVERRFLSRGEKIPIRNLTATTSEYIYLWLDTKRTSFRGRGVVDFRWDFDSIQEASSSSTSSSIYSPLIDLDGDKSLNLYPEECEVVYVDLELDYSEYTTIRLWGEAVTIFNNGGTFYLEDERFNADGDTKLVVFGVRTYTIAMVSYTEGIIRILRDGDCLIPSHILMTTGDDILQTDGSSLILTAV